MNSENAISVREAAQITGLTEQTIRNLCERGDIGICLKRKGAKRGQYIVSPAKLNAFIGGTN